MTAEEFKQETGSLLHVLTRQAQLLLHNKEDAEDVAQDVLAKLWGMRDDLHRPVAPLARVLTRNFCIDRIRRSPHLLELDSNHTAGAVLDTDAAQQNQQNELIDHMMHAMEHLPPKQQLILRLRHMDGLDMVDIAQLTGDTETNIRQILCRARQGVRKMLVKTRFEK